MTRLQPISENFALPTDEASETGAAVAEHALPRWALPLAGALVLAAALAFLLLLPSADRHARAAELTPAQLAEICEETAQQTAQALRASLSEDDVDSHRVTATAEGVEVSFTYADIEAQLGFRLGEPGFIDDYRSAKIASFASHFLTRLSAHPVRRQINLDLAFSGSISAAGPTGFGPRAYDGSLGDIVVSHPTLNGETVGERRYAKGQTLDRTDLALIRAYRMFDHFRDYAGMTIPLAANDRLEFSATTDTDAEAPFRHGRVVFRIELKDFPAV